MDLFILLNAHLHFTMRQNNLDRYTAMKLLYHPICQMDIGVDIGENSQIAITS